MGIESDGERPSAAPEDGPAAWAWVRELRDPAVLRADILAGLTGAIVVLPQGVAFATLAGMPPQYGLYAAMVPCIIAALLGSSRLMVTGPANAISLTVLALLTPLAVPESARYVTLAVTLALMVGVWTLLLGLFKAGSLTKYVSHAVIVGFTTGAALLIMASQIGNFLGVSIPRGQGISTVFPALLAALPEVSPHSIVVGVCTLVAGVIARRAFPSIPFLLLAMVAGAAVAAALAASVPGALTIRTMLALPGAIPPLSAPDVALETLGGLLMPSLAMTVLAVSEAISIAKAIAQKKGHAFNANRELIGQGVANIVGSFFSAYPASGSFNRSGVNLESNARTPCAAVCAALFLVLILFFVGPYLRFLPYPAMAAVLFMVAWGLIDRPEIRRLYRDSRERLVMGVTFLATLTLPLQWALCLGVVTSLVACQHCTRR